ncbi:LPS export ABC transporter periplasmic protein LptC [Stenotrophomonas mori]|uniref:Lipopolysaccharide export system protein LptC n=1 Tax=Stenotrophomonas mori TaxID=2871096 RepID=A0ABT0SDX4_9GAMM|nr:LPS export ABC transporter periplasmic protein LptC [Stenotrophomonas mori]MCL7713316.1 LPS export ABC transporter periplasmic protein LptC [Stenotrophomonas mori]
MNTRLLIGGALLLAALASGWSAWKQRGAKGPAPAAAQRADFILGDFEIISLDKDGKERITLRAPSMERNKADQTSSIVRPLFLLPDADGQHWQLRADTGWVSAKGEELRLRGHVAGDSPRDGTTPPTTFRTSKLNIYPDRNQARTSARVTMTRPGLRQTGTGFRVNLDTRQYSLLSEVKTRYEPNAARQAR